MKAFSSKYHKSLFIGMSLLLLLIFTITACGGGSSTGISPSPNHRATTPGSNNHPTSNTTPRSGLTPGGQPCPNAVSVPSYWDPIIGTPSAFAKVESVSCAYLIGAPTLQALVNVRYDGSGAILDTYVYTNITNPSPTQLFKLQGLYKGDTRISAYNTIITAEVDSASRINNNQPNASLVQDLFREFQWSNDAGTFMQVSFPGIFPDLTRFQAEADQAQINQGHQPWKLDATMTAKALAVNLLKWSTSVPTTIVSGGGPHDASAVVIVRSTSPGGSSITVTLSRLEGNTDSGIWEATAVEADTASISKPVSRDRLSSPVTVTGTGNAFEGKIGTVTVLDHLYTDIGRTDANGTIGNGNTTFSTNVTYHSTFQAGVQEGLVVLYIYSNADGSIATAVIVKELLS